MGLGSQRRVLQVSLGFTALSSVCFLGEMSSKIVVSRSEEQAMDERRDGSRTGRSAG